MAPRITLSQEDRQQLNNLAAEWRDMLLAEDRDDAELLLELHAAGAGGTPITTTRMPIQRNQAGYAMEHAGKIAAKMESYTSGMRATTRFVVVGKSSRAGAPLAELGQLPFTVEWGIATITGAERGYEMSEGPTDVGERAQAMRMRSEDHRTRIHGHVVTQQGFEKLIDRLQIALDSAHATIERLNAERQDQFMAWQESEDRKTERSFILEQARRELDAKDRNINGFWMMAPLFASFLLPKEHKAIGLEVVKMLRENFMRPTQVPAPQMAAAPQGAASKSSAPAKPPIGKATDGVGGDAAMFLETLSAEQRHQIVGQLSPKQRERFEAMEKSPSHATIKAFTDGFSSLEEVSGLMPLLAEEQQASILMIFNQVLPDEPQPAAAE